MKEVPSGHQSICSVFGPVSLPLLCFVIKCLLKEFNSQAQCAIANSELLIPLASGAIMQTLQQEAEGSTLLSQCSSGLRRQLLEATSGVSSKMSPGWTPTVTILVYCNGAQSCPQSSLSPHWITHTEQESFLK
jgi:hypothetical protein